MNGPLVPERWSFMQGLWLDIRFAIRGLWKSPAFTITALATVAICVGVNLAIFAVINSVLLRPLPFPQPDRLVTIYNTYPKAGVENDGSSITNYYERRGNIPAFESLSMYMERAETVGDPGSMQQEEIVRISPEFFATLGVSPVIGRNFTEEETANKWYPKKDHWRPASWFSLSLIRGARFSPDQIRHGTAWVESAPF
jgi:hypothetical protein